MYDQVQTGKSAGAFIGGAGLQGTASMPPPNGHGRAEIASLLEMQEKATVLLYDVLSRLEDKLRPVLAPVPSAAERDGAPTPGAGSQVGGLILSNTERVASAVRHVERLISELAL